MSKLFKISAIVSIGSCTWGEWIDESFCGVSFELLDQYYTSDQTFGQEECQSFCRNTDTFFGEFFPDGSTFCCDFEIWSFDDKRACKIWLVDNQREQDMEIFADDELSSFLYYHQEYIDQEKERAR